MSSLCFYPIQKYQESITTSREDKSALDSVIALLEHTSDLVSLFNDRLYISSSNDSRLRKLKSATEAKNNLVKNSNKFLVQYLIEKENKFWR